MEVTLGARPTFWRVFAAAYALLLTGVAALYVFDPDMTASEKLLGLLIVVAAPAVAFALAAGPLWRRSQNRLLLLVGATVAVAVAVVVTIVTWGLALPVIAILVALAIADVNVALVLSGVHAKLPRYAVLAAAVAVLAALVGLIVPLAILGLGICIAVVVWRLVRRPRLRPGA
jgi:uncharacterized membrane protein